MRTHSREQCLSNFSFPSFGFFSAKAPSMSAMLQAQRKQTWLGEKGMCNRNAHPSFVFIHCPGVNSQRAVPMDCSGKPTKKARPTCRSRTPLPPSRLRPLGSLSTGKQLWLTSQRRQAFSLNTSIFKPIIS